jgi:hypothetical protein
VAGDNPAFEVFPPTDWNTSCRKSLPLWSSFSYSIASLDQFLLGAIGSPIGEMFFLEALADDCAKDNVYEFFFTSAPLNKFKGIATPPNALCVK